MSDYLPQEVLVNILKRLPPKSVIKFRCVSKSWTSLISSPYFVSLHTQQASLSNSLAAPQTVSSSDAIPWSKMLKFIPYTVTLTSCTRWKISESKTLFGDLTQFYYRIVGSSNGVLCLTDDLFGHTHNIFLWNPVIRRKVTLPQPKPTLESTWPCMCVLGFGFDVKNDDYKVVRVAYALVEYGYSAPPKVEVYALSEGNWRGVRAKFPPSWMVDYFLSQAFVNGNVPWVAYRSKARVSEAENLIMVFDISNEVFDELPLPDPLANVLPFNLNTAILRQSIAVYHYDTRVSSNICSIWEMKKYGDAESWSKQFHIDLEGRLGTVLGVRRNGDALLTAGNGELIAYNQDTEARMKLGIIGTKHSFYACSSVESLALLLEGDVAQGRKQGKNELECASSEDNDEDPYRRVEKGELQKRSIALHCLTVMLDGWYLWFRSK